MIEPNFGRLGSSTSSRKKPQVQYCEWIVGAEWIQNVTRSHAAPCTERKLCLLFASHFVLPFAHHYVLLLALHYVFPFALHYVLLLPTLHVSMFCTEDLFQTAKYLPWRTVPALKKMWPCLLSWDSPWFRLLKETTELAAKRRDATSRGSLCPVPPDEATTKSATHRRIVTNKQTNIVWFYLLFQYKNITNPTLSLANKPIHAIYRSINLIKGKSNKEANKAMLSWFLLLETGKA